MRITFLILIICILFSSAEVQAQENKPASNDLGSGSGNCADCQSYESKKLYLENSPNRVIRIEADLFQTQINGQKKWNSTLKIFSYAEKFHFFHLKGNSKFSFEDSNAVNIFAENKKLPIQSIYYANFRQRVVNNEKKGFISFQPKIENSRILDEKGLDVNGTLGELISLRFSLDEFRKLANTKKIKIKIDKEEYGLSKDQISEITFIAEKINPE